ncbi:DUF494 family protein [Parvibium lacunae]|uniref:Protein Smg homolog n=1 Tax=Parvibium lacunae TaxID=1888893 RepID=A0A368L0M8_9BURK|nr:DUF494 domain-containing protein [Parvibium lacunae]RCS56995.1 DUF494 domain-containing protein [Parvibium lacunae]
MLDVLVYLFHTYYTPEACPDQSTLARKLTALGFEAEEISDALGWLQGLAQLTQDWQANSMDSSSAQRVYADTEYEALGQEGIGLITFLENAGALPPTLRELVIERTLAIAERPIPVSALRIVTLMVLWSQQVDVDTLVLEELFREENEAVLH